MGCSTDQTRINAGSSDPLSLAFIRVRSAFHPWLKNFGTTEFAQAGETLPAQISLTVAKESDLQIALALFQRRSSLPDENGGHRMPIGIIG